MASQKTSETNAKVGVLIEQNWSDFKTPQEFAESLAEKLEITVEAGESVKGDKGETVVNEFDGGFRLNLLQKIPIPIGVSSIVVTGDGADLSNKYVRIESDGGSFTPSETIGVGPVVGSTVHFVFSSGTTTAVDVFSLAVYEIVETDVDGTPI